MLLNLLRSLVRGAPRSPAVPRPAAHPEAKDASPAVLDPLSEARSALDRGALANARLHLERARGAGENSVACDVMLATVLAQQGEVSSAERILTPWLDHRPAVPDAHNTMGNIRRMQGRLDDAIAHYDLALATQPDFAVALSNRALCQHESGHFEDALRGYQRAIAIEPQDVTATTNLAALEFDLGLDADARTHLEQVLHIAPGLAQAHWVLGFGLLRGGDFDRGWTEYEWRERDSGRTQPSPDLPEWRGGKIAEGPLLVCAEQGLGDQIMFASCIEDLTNVVDDCVVECDPRLVRLFERSFPRIRVVPHLKTGIEPWRNDRIAPRVKTWLGSLPLQYRKHRGAFPERHGYLSADPLQVDAWRTRLSAVGTGLKVGISWRGGTPSTRRSTRSIPLVDWLPLLRLPNVHFIDLQYGDHAEELDAVVRTHDIRLTRWPQALAADYDATAALVDALDLVISVQTSVVHLAGALGKEAWVLVPRVPEWRYGNQGRDMPWYPSVRLFRQMSTDWTEVLTEVKTALSRKTDQLRHSAGTYL